MERINNLRKQGLVIYGAVEPALNRYYPIMLGMALGMLLTIVFIPVYFRPNAEPVQMDETYREQWIKGTANEYLFIVNSVQNDENLSEEDRLRQQAIAENEVKDRLTEVGATTSDINDLIRQNPDVDYLQESLLAIQPIAVQVEAAAQTQKDDAQIPGTFSRIFVTLLIFIAFALLGVLITVTFKLFDIPFLKQIKHLINPREEDPALAAAKARKAAREQAAGLKTAFDTEPVAQFMSTFLAGDNYYDDSFAIELDDENKTFLGECGSGISESITIEGTKKVIATEVWIFDKNDISTITKLLVSESAYNDEELRAKLAPRGDLFIAREGEKFELETQTLRAQATVVSLEYGEGEQPNHVYDKVTVEIAVWQKEGAAGGGGGDDDDGFPQPIIDVDALLAQQEAERNAQAAAAPTTPPPMTNVAPAPPQQPISPPPTQQSTQPMPQQRPISDSQPMSAPPQRPPQQQPPLAPPPQQRPMSPPPAQGAPPQRPPQAAPPQQRPPQQFPAAPPPQQRPMSPPPAQGAPPQRPPQQRPPQFPSAPPQQRPTMPPQQGSGQRPVMPPQQGGQRPNMPPQGGQRPPLPPQGGDTGDFNLQ